MPAGEGRGRKAVRPANQGHDRERSQMRTQTGKQGMTQTRKLKATQNIKETKQRKREQKTQNREKRTQNVSQKKTQTERVKILGHFCSVHDNRNQSKGFIYTKNFVL